MTGWLSLMTLTIAVSMDSFGVGVTYGARKMKISFVSILLIACCSAVVLLAAMNVGTIISNFISEKFAEATGGMILILLGGYVLWQFMRSNAEPAEHRDETPSQIWNMEIKSLGIVVQILRTPDAADIDRSGTINGLEALLLGLALSLDSFAAGIGASLLGFPNLLTAVVVATMSSCFLLAGMKIGQFFSRFSFVRVINFLPGLILIVLGVMKL